MTQITFVRGQNGGLEIAIIDLNIPVLPIKVVEQPVKPVIEAH